MPRTSRRRRVVLVHTDEGVTGVASGGDGLPDRELLERLLVGLDPLRTEVVREICETVDLHGGRPWAVEIAVWDAVGKALGVPLWQLLGGRSERLLAYASSGELLEPEERVERCVALRERGIRAVKIRFHLGRLARRTSRWSQPCATQSARGWRSWSTRTRAGACPATARRAGTSRPRRSARASSRRSASTGSRSRCRTDDVDGYRSLRSRTGIRLAAGELVRTAAEARDLVVRGGVDVVQADVLFVGGIGGCRRVAALADLHGRAWSPHTWSNGLGLVANLHAALAFSTVPFVEVPFDPPAWSPERRDWLLPEPLEIAADGTIAPPAGPGLGVELDLDALERWRVA